MARRALRLIQDAATETTVTVAVPFALYLLADRVGASGVLAVLAAGLLLRSTGSKEMTSAGWLLGRSVWQYVEFAVSGLLFAFLGVVLIDVPRRARRTDSGTPYGWREAAVASWAGMCGVVTVATALALPHTMTGGGPFPARQEVVLVALLVVIVTLVAQGLTLAPLIRRLGVASTVDVRLDVRRLHRVATEAALEHLRDVEDVPDEVRAAVLRQYESRLGYRKQVLDLVDGDAGGQDAGTQLRRLLARATEAEREAVLRARRRGEVSPAAADDVLFDVEARALRYEE